MAAHPPAGAAGTAGAAVSACFLPTIRWLSDSSIQKNSGAKNTATTVEATMPPITPVPMARRLFAPGPVAIASGTQPRPNASEVITIARMRARAASSAASSTPMPWRTCSIATSQIRIAFFADRPTSVTRPTWK